MKTNTIEHQITPSANQEYQTGLEYEPQILPGAEGIVKTANVGENLNVPNYLSSEEVILPSINVVTYRGNNAAIVPLFMANDRLNTMYSRASRGKEDRAGRMQYEMLARILDTSGADGLHHMHSRDTRFPRTIFYNARHNSGLKVYMTSLGETPEGKPIYGVLTATNGPKDERDLLRYVGHVGSYLKGRR